VSTSNSKPYIILYVLKELGKGITTRASEVFKLGDEVTKQQLLNFAKEEGMIYEQGEHLILIRNMKETIYVKAVEYLVKGDGNENKS